MVDDSGQRGRPVLGAIAGFILGLALAVDLLLLGSIPLDSALAVLPPIILFVIGLVAGSLAPSCFLRRWQALCRSSSYPRPIGPSP